MRHLQEALLVDKVAKELTGQAHKEPFKDVASDFMRRFSNFLGWKETCLFFAKLWFYLPSCQPESLA